MTLASSATPSCPSNPAPAVTAAMSGPSRRTPLLGGVTGPCPSPGSEFRRSVRRDLLGGQGGAAGVEAVAAAQVEDEVVAEAVQPAVLDDRADRQVLAGVRAVPAHLVRGVAGPDHDPLGLPRRVVAGGLVVLDGLQRR